MASKWIRGRSTARANRLPPATIENRLGSWHLLAPGSLELTRCGRDMRTADPQRRSSDPQPGDRLCAECAPEAVVGLFRGLTPDAGVIGPARPEEAVS